MCKLTPFGTDLSLIVDVEIPTFEVANVGDGHSGVGSTCPPAGSIFYKWADSQNQDQHPSNMSHSQILQMFGQSNQQSPKVKLERDRITLGLDGSP
jgi:hypothetical protein